MKTLPRATLCSVAAVLLLALAAPTVLAQVPQPGVTVTLDETSLALGASNSTSINGTVSYSDTAPALAGGAADGTLTLGVAVPANWTYTLEPASAFALAPGESAPFTLTLTAPAAGAGAETGDALVTASATSADGQRSATGEATLALTRVDPPAPVVIPWYQTPGGLAGLVILALLLAGSVAYVARRRRAERLAAERAATERAAYLDRETGITLGIVAGPLQYGHKREVVFRVAVKNESQRSRIAHLDIAEVTNGWRAGLQVSRIPLAAGETQTATLVVTPDAVITPGDKSTVTLRVKPEEAREKDERLTLEVTAPKAGVPTDPHYRIVTVHRESVGMRPR